MHPRISAALATLALGTILALAAPLATAQDSDAVVKRVMELHRKMLSGEGRPANAPDPSNSKARKPTAYEKFEWYGLMQVAKDIAYYEGEADRLLKLNEQQSKSAEALYQKMLGAAGNKAVDTGVDNREGQGVGWYCMRAVDIVPQLATVAQKVKEVSSKYAKNISMVPLGQGPESSRKLELQAAEFQKELSGVLTNPQTASMLKDLDKVAEGLAPSKAVAKAEISADAAAAAAALVRKTASDLQNVGVELVPLIDIYVTNRRELGQEIADLKPLVEHPKRAAMLADLEKELRNSRKSARTGAEWQQIINKDVEKKYGLADTWQDWIKKVKDPTATELEPCKQYPDLPHKFAGARKGASAFINDSLSLVLAAYETRNREIAEKNKEMDKAVATFEQVRIKATEKAKIVYVQLQTMDRKSPEWREREQLYDRLEKRRKEATDSMEAIRKQRGDYADEQTTVKSNMGAASRELGGLLGKGFGGN